MFLAIVCIAIGLALLLNALGIATGTFWAFFWAVIFIAIGVGLLLKKSDCPMCGWGTWHKGANGKDQGDCCGHKHEN